MKIEKKLIYFFLVASIINIINNLDRSILVIMTTLHETPVQHYERLKHEIHQHEHDMNIILNDKASLIERLNYLTNELSKIEINLQEKMLEKKSLEDAFNALNQTTTGKHVNPSSNENNEIVPRSDTPLTLNSGKTKQSWASMCETDSDDDASIATNENDDNSIQDESEEVFSNNESIVLSTQECNSNDICKACLFKITDKGGLFHLKTLDGQDVKHTDRSSGHLNVFRFKSGKFLENYPNVVKGMEIPVRLDANFPNNNLIWGVLNMYKATVIRFEEKIVNNNVLIQWIPVLELTTLLGEKLEGTYTFGIVGEKPWYPNRKQPSLNDTYLVSLSKNSNDEANRVYFKDQLV